MTRRESLLATTSVLLSLIAFFGLCEVVLRFMPVATGLGSRLVTRENPIFRFTPNKTFVFSRDWAMQLVNRGRINNDGWVNDQNYARESTLPLLAIVGDSYIEAAMVPYARTVQGWLAQQFEGKLRVYSFAASGAPLSQYIIWARYAVEHFSAKALVINVVGNDFDESHIDYKSSPGFWYYAPDPNGRLLLQLSEFRPSIIRKLVRASAVGRYLAINILPNIHLPALTPTQQQFAGNTAAVPMPKRIADSEAVIDAFFRDLHDVVGLPRERVLFIVDGFRYPDVAAQFAGSYFDLMRRSFLDKSSAKGY